MADDAFALIREAGTNAGNYDLDTEDIINHLKQWQSLCSFTVTGAKHDTVDIEFATLPADMDAFAQDLYDFCPDLVDQGTGCMAEMIESMEEMGEELSPRVQKLIEGVDFEDDNYGVEILRREVQEGMSVQLWWD
jgi:hypothetical protein